MYDMNHESHVADPRCFCQNGNLESQTSGCQRRIKFIACMQTNQFGNNTFKILDLKTCWCARPADFYTFTLDSFIDALFVHGNTGILFKHVVVVNSKNAPLSSLSVIERRFTVRIIDNLFARCNMQRNFSQPAGATEALARSKESSSPALNTLTSNQHHFSQKWVNFRSPPPFLPKHFTCKHSFH